VITDAVFPAVERARGKEGKDKGNADFILRLRFDLAFGVEGEASG